MAMSEPLLILFDIDGTLIQSGRAGVRAMNLAFERLHGRRQALDGVTLAGRTDRAIVSDVFRAIGIEPADADILRLRNAYVDCLADEIRRPVSDPSGVLPGVLALLDRLAALEAVAVGLLTGNFEGGAAVKLRHFALWDRFPFGAFGDQHADRRLLLPVALDRAASSGHGPFDRNAVVVIGDTPLDVDCARAHGALAIGVATGPFSRADLQQAGADLTVATLETIETAVFRTLRERRRSGGSLRESNPPFPRTAGSDRF